MDDLVFAHWGEHADGGGDRVAWELARAFPGSPLYVGQRDRSIEPDDLDIRELSGGPLSDLGMRAGGPLRMAAHLFRWQVARELREFDTLVTSGNEPLFYVAPEAQTWVAYVHHTNRRQSDLLDEVDSGLSGAAKLAFYYLVRVLFDHNTHRPDLYVANSEIVKRRINRYWGVPNEKIRVAYPPVDTDSFSPSDSETGDYYLTLSRLDWHKRIDEVVRTFNDLPDETLVIAGKGSERDRLEEIANDNVTFTGFVSEQKKQELLSEAKAFVFNARNEDFGIAPVEALAAGTPLLGVHEGMTKFQVIDGKNGYTYYRDSEEGPGLREAVERFESEGIEWSPNEIATFAERFSVEAFRGQMAEAIAEAEDRATVVPEWYEQYVTDPDVSPRS